MILGIKKIGTLDDKVIHILSLNAKPNSPIRIGDDNIKHMLTKHPEDFNMFKNQIANIIAFFDYIRLNSKDNAIEFVK